jgi:hypothetical protein
MGGAMRRGAIAWRGVGAPRAAATLAGVLVALGLAAAASAARVETIEAPSRHVDPSTALFANGDQIGRAHV